MGKMKIHGKGGLLDFSKDKLTERNKENSFLDVDWIITGNFFILYTLVQVNCNNLRNNLLSLQQFCVKVNTLKENFAIL